MTEVLKKDHGQLMEGTSSYSQSDLSTSSRLAWLYVSLLAASYALCTLLLHTVAPVDAGVWSTFMQEVPSEVFSWQLAGFGGVLVLNIINLMFCSTAVQYNCNVLLVLIHSVAFATDWLIEQQATPVVVSWGGRMFLPLRYVQWMHTTPTMILLMSMMSDLTAGRVAGAVLGDLVMVLTGLAASWTAGLTQVGHPNSSTMKLPVVHGTLCQLGRAWCYQPRQRVAHTAGHLMHCGGGCLASLELKLSLIIRSPELTDPSFTAQ